MWFGELSDKYTAAVYVFATMEEEIVDFNVGCETVIFQNIISHSFEISEAWVATSRLDHHLLACHGW